MRSLPLAFLLTLLTVANWPGPVASAEECDVEFVAGLGLACLRPDGLYELFAEDGTSLGYTHGHDPVPPEREIAAATPQNPDCIENPTAPAQQYYMKVIYARASNDANTYTTSAPMIRELVRSAQGLLLESSNQVGRSVWYRVECTSGVIDVYNAVLPTPLASTTFSTVAQDLWDLGFTDYKTKLWVWFDDTSACSCGGTGHVMNDARQIPDNANNGLTFLPRVAVTWGYNSARIMMHENGHNLGAVQNDSPNTSGGWHCNDGQDIMCYADGGSQSNYNPNVCAVEVFDCNHNDYFHPNALDTSYIGSHWNLGHPFNRFMRGCLDGWGRLTAPTPGVFVVIQNVNTHSFDLPASCQGHLYGAQMVTPVVTQQLTWTFPPYDLDVCFWNGAVFLVCHQTLLGYEEQGRVPDTATRAEVRLRAGVNVDYLFRIM